MMEYHDPIFIKALGSLLGAIAGLVYIKPRNIRDALSRTFISTVAGVTFYFLPIDFFGWPKDSERIIAGALLVSFAAWPLAGVLFKWISKRAE